MIRDSSFIRSEWLSRSSLEVAPDLLGCTLVRQFSDGLTLRGMIVETEAYTVGDPACHAYRRQTDRNRIMFGPAGMSYVYLIYGIYHCLNVVTDRDGVPSAVLIRALQLDSLPPWCIDEKLARVAAGPWQTLSGFQNRSHAQCTVFSTWTVNVVRAAQSPVSSTG